MFIIQTLIEFAVALFIIWGLFHEDTLIEFEEKIAKVIKDKIRNAKHAHVKVAK